MGLKLLNSLTGELEAFIPGNGRRVLWYTCGPTVYDSCHMGHARAYLTFDILRRIMEDYFGYEVLFQCNITDIDDKIILRSRRNLLVSNYAASNTDFDTVFREMQEEVQKKQKKLAATLSALEKKEAPKERREQEERETQIKAARLKCSQADGVAAKLAIVNTLKSCGEEAGWLSVKGFVQGRKQWLELLTKKLKDGTQGDTAADQALLVSLREKQKEGEPVDGKEFTRVLGQVEKAVASGGVAEVRAAIKAELANSSDECAKAVLHGVEDLVVAIGLWKEKGPVTAVIEIGNDELGEKLDNLLKHTVTDHSVFMSHARKYEKEYMEDMSRLGIREPDVLTRVTEYVPKIIAYVQTIISKGFAYETNGSVYLSIEEFKKRGHCYRKCDPFQGDTSAEMMAESEGALSDETGKRHPNDFALWKCSKPGEPEWDSPWGKGRPGWHIECSVVASDIMGGNMDLHAGGSDLKFPHHDNELAQSEAYFDHQQWVNYFIHAGHLHIKGLKMAKSLKNFIKIREALEEHTPRQLRLMFLLSPWHRPMNYSDQAMGDAKAKESTFKNFFGTIKAIARTNWVDREVGWTEEDRKLFAKVAAMQHTVHESLCNNFDTVGAMSAMIDTVNEINKYNASTSKPSVYLLKKAAMYITRILRIFGVVDGADDIGWSAGDGAGDFESKIGPFVDAVVHIRNDLRTAARKNVPHKELLEMSDRIRDQTLVDLGVSCTDQSDGTSRWALENPAVLKKTLELKRKLEQEQEEKKLANAIVKQEAVIAKLRETAVPPTEMFKTAEYSAWNEQGLPTITAAGGPVSAASSKKLQKLLEKRQQVYEALIKTAEGDIAALIAKEEAKLEELRRPRSS